jgi:hypothetical protein
VVSAVEKKGYEDIFAAPTKKKQPEMGCFVVEI